MHLTAFELLLVVILNLLNFVKLKTLQYAFDVTASASTSFDKGRSECFLVKNARKCLKMPQIDPFEGPELGGAKFKKYFQKSWEGLK